MYGVTVMYTVLYNFVNISISLPLRWLIQAKKMFGEENT